MASGYLLVSAAKPSSSSNRCGFRTVHVCYVHSTLLFAHIGTFRYLVQTARTLSLFEKTRGGTTIMACMQTWYEGAPCVFQLHSCQSASCGKVSMSSSLCQPCISDMVSITYCVGSVPVTFRSYRPKQIRSAGHWCDAPHHTPARPAAGVA